MIGPERPRGGEGPADGDGTIQSVRRALRILKVLGEADRGLSLSEAARAVGLAVSTTHRILTTLEFEGFAHSSGRAWHVGSEACAVGTALLRQGNLDASAAPVLRRLRGLTRETVNLGVLRENEVFTIAQLESRELARAVSSPGGRAPALNSGMGKAILAQWSREDLARHVRRHGLRPMTARSLASLETVTRELDAVRARGFALDDEECRIGVRCVAAPVFGPHGEPVGAISVSGLAARIDGARTGELGHKIREAAAMISASLGGAEGGGGSGSAVEHPDWPAWSLPLQ